jgi:hypothetical protein
MKAKSTLIIILLVAVLFSSGCANKEVVKPPLYVWGNYQYTSTAYGMSDGETEFIEKHIQELEKIINESESKDKRVAPGIYAEYGQALHETGERLKAKKYFMLEKQTYPESATFISRAISTLYGD